MRKSCPRVGEPAGVSADRRATNDVTYATATTSSHRSNARRSFTGVTPKIGVTYRLAPQHSVYASVGGGIEVPAGNETDPASTFGQDTVTALNPLLSPIRSTTYEVGTKRAWTRGETAFLRDISYDVALYHTAVKDEIVPYRGGRFYFTAGRVRRRGAELGARVATRAGVSLQVALTWTVHRYTRYLFDSCTTPGPYPAPSRRQRQPGGGSAGVHRGCALDVAPRAFSPERCESAWRALSAFFADDAKQSSPGVPDRSLTLVLTTRWCGEGVGGARVRDVHNLSIAVHSVGVLNPTRGG